MKLSKIFANLGELQNIIPILVAIQEFVVILLCLSLFGVMGMKIWELFASLIYPLKVEIVIADTLFILILVELLRLLIVYLQEKTISVSVAVEVTIVSILREVIVKGILEINESKIGSVSEFLLVLAGLLLIPILEKYLDRKDPNSEDIQLSNLHYEPSKYN